jgi:drug/metabolite transporter (DMT)-like permease
VTCIKETVAFSFAVAWALSRYRGGLPVFPSKREIGILILVALAVQLIGNVGSLWAMGKVGLVIAIPTNSGSQLLTCALFGWLILGERVTFRSGIALGALMIALVLLGFGADAARGSLSPSNSAAAMVGLAVSVSLLVGVVYAAMSIAMRRAMNQSVEACAILFFFSGIGVTTMWPLSVYHEGLSGMISTPPDVFAWMLAASFFNLVGFLSFAKGLQLTTVVHANFLNASQVALLALAGMTFFQEPKNPWLILGVMVTLVGIMLIDRPPEAVEVVETTV